MIYGNRPARRQGKKGFTLLELLIVIAILAILATVLVLVLNPAETLKKSRDTQRMSDLATMKTAIGLYMTTVNSPTLASTTDTGTNPRVEWSNTACQDTTVGTFLGSEDRIFYSLPSAGSNDATEITDTTLDTFTFSAGFGATQVSSSYNSLPDGTGWIPIKFSNITGGSPISNLPTDPTNSVANIAVVKSTDLVYRFACSNVSSILQYEIDARLESAAYGPGSTSDDRSKKDGGNSDLMYEVGTILSILGGNSDGGTGF